MDIDPGDKVERLNKVKEIIDGDSDEWHKMEALNSMFFPLVSSSKEDINNNSSQE